MFILILVSYVNQVNYRYGLATLAFIDKVNFDY